MDCVSFNCQSLHNKTQKILEYLIVNKIHLATLQETWLKTTDTTIFSEISKYNFKSLKNLRSKKDGGGLLVLYQPRLKIKKLSSILIPLFTTFEYLIFNISFNKQILVCVNIYRPLYSKQHRCTLKMFLEELKIFICNILSKYDNILICGDFNIPCNNVMDTQVSEFLRLLQTKNFCQLTKTMTVAL